MAELSEAEFQEQVRALCRWRGVLVYHTHDSRRSDAGFPDLVIVGADSILYRELKKEGGRVTPDQQRWIEAINAAGGDAAVWRPSQFSTDVRHDITRMRPVLKVGPSPAEIRRKMARRG